MEEIITEQCDLCGEFSPEDEVFTQNDSNGDPDVSICQTCIDQIEEDQYQSIK